MANLLYENLAFIDVLDNTNKKEAYTEQISALWFVFQLSNLSPWAWLEIAIKKKCVYRNTSPKGGSI